MIARTEPDPCTAERDHADGQSGLMPASVTACYDAIARTYAIRFIHELDNKPFDRAFLNNLALNIPDGPILDAGCGPGSEGISAT